MPTVSSIPLSAEALPKPDADVPPRSSGKHIPQLDILRGLAILLVIGVHSSLVYPDGGGVFGNLGRWWMRFGWTGVDLFFVLSGFLIGGLLFIELRERERLDVKRFLVRRAFKIWPGYVALLLYTIVMAAGDHGQGVMGAAQALWPNFLHVQNYVATPYIGHTWSLAVEEHAYLLLPLLLWVATRKRRGPITSLPSVVVALVSVVVVCTSLRFAWFYAVPHRVVFVPVSQSQLRLDSIAFGVLLAYFHCFHPDMLRRLARRPLALFVFGLVLISPMWALKFTTHPIVNSLGLSLLYVGYGAILVSMVYTPMGEGRFGRSFQSLIARVLIWIGAYTYSIYLWHFEARKLMGWLVQHGFLASLSPVPRWWGVTMLFVLTAIVLGVITAKLIEYPALALRERIMPRIATVPARPPETSATAN